MTVPSSIAAVRRMAPEDAERELARELLRREQAQRNADRFARYANDPCAWIRDILRVVLWSRQEEIAMAIWESQFTATRSGHKIGKTKLIASVGLAWVHLKPRGKGLLTSGNKDQVKAQIWAEVRDIYRRCDGPRVLGGSMPKDPSTGYDLGDGRTLLGLTADDEVKIAGYSGDQLLVEIDEASGFPQKLWEAIQGNCGGGGHAAMFGNPTSPVGPFRRAFKSPLFRKFRVDSRESPNVIAGKKLIPGLALREYVEQMQREYPPGDGHPVFDARVAGEFPTSGEMSVVAERDLDDAVTRYTGGTIRGEAVLPAAGPPVVGALVLGVDVARFGSDDSAVAGVRGQYGYPPRDVHGHDSIAVSALVVEYAKAHARGGETVTVNVDGNGVGAGVVDQLRAYAAREDADVRLVVHDVNAGSAALDPQKFPNRRSELWWALRTWLAEGATLAPDEKRDEEIKAPKYSFDERQRIRVEAKDDIKKKLQPQRSPDRADALCLAVLAPAEVDDDAGVISGETRDAAKIGRAW